MISLQFFALFALILTALQDFKFRGVYWIIFPVLALSLGIIKFHEAGLEVFLMDLAISSTFVALQLLCLWVYLSIRFRTIKSFPSEYLGWGDILFFVVMCFYLPPITYLYFYIASLSCAILFALVQNFYYKAKVTTIPLAGIQALLLAIILGVQWFVSNIVYQYA